MSDDERKYTLKEEEISDGEKIIIENQKILNDLNSKLDSLSNNLKNNIEIDKSQNSLIDLYENITSKLKKDLIQIQEEIIKEKDESEQNKNDALVENDLEIIQENINALNKKYEEEIKKNIVLNQINENTKTELEKLRNENKEKEKQLEILKEANKNLLDSEKIKDNAIKEKEDIIQNYKILINELKEGKEKAKEQLIKEKEEINSILEKEKKQHNELKKNMIIIQNNFKEEKNKKNQEIKNYEIINRRLSNEVENNKKVLAKKDEEIKACSQNEAKYNKLIQSLKEQLEYKFQMKSIQLKEELTKNINQSLNYMKNQYDNMYKNNENTYIFKFNELRNIIEKQKSNIKQPINIPEYSYECVNKNDLIFKYNENTNVTKYIVLNNNGNLTWAQDSKLKIVDDLNKTIVEFYLKSQEPGEVVPYSINFYFLNNYKNGQYKVYLEFYSAGKKYGEKLEIKIKQKDEVNVDEFRQRFKLTKEQKSDWEILKYLKENNYDFNLAFYSMYQ